MFADIMNYQSFAFWYWFVIAWFFVAAVSIFYVVIKDGINAMSLNKRKSNVYIREQPTYTESIPVNE